MKKKREKEIYELQFSISCDNLDDNRKIYLELIDQILDMAYSNDEVAEKNLTDLYHCYDIHIDSNVLAKKHIATALSSGINRVFDILKKSNDTFGLILLGNCYEWGHCTDIDRPKAFQMYLSAATLGSSEGKYEVGRMYKDGIGVDQDKQKMFMWYNEAANHNSIRAQFELGRLYDIEKSFINKDKAYKWYKKAAYNGHKEAQFSLARLLLDDLDIPIDEKQAQYWMLEALNQGHLKAFKWYIEKWGNNWLLKLSIQEIEKLYKLYADNLPKDIIQRLCKSYCENAYRALTSNEKFEWFLKAKKLNVTPLNKEILDYYEVYFTKRLTYNDINTASSFLMRWFNDKNSFLQWICNIDNILVKEIFAYKFYGVNRSIADEYFFMEYEKFGETLLNNEYNDFYKQGKVNIYERSIHWYERLLKDGNVEIKDELTDLYNLTAELDGNIERKIDKYKKSAFLDSEIGKRKLIELYCRIAEESDNLYSTKNMYIKSFELCTDENARKNIMSKLCQTLIDLADTIHDFSNKEKYYFEAIQYGAKVATNKLYNLYLTELRSKHGILDLNNLCNKLIEFFRLTSKKFNSNKLLSQVLIKEAEKEVDNEKSLILYHKAYDYEPVLGREYLCNKYIQMAELSVNPNEIKTFFDKAHQISIDEENKNKIKQRYIEKIICRAEECNYLEDKLELYLSVLEIDVRRVLPMIFNIYENMELDSDLQMGLDIFKRNVELKGLQDLDVEYIKTEFTKCLNRIIDNIILSNNKNEWLCIDLVSRIVDFTGELSINYLHYVYYKDSIEFDIEESIKKTELSKNFIQSDTGGKLELEGKSIEEIFILANSYFHGYSVVRDTRLAVILYKYAAENGHAEAQICLGDCYLFGYGTEKSMIKSYYWYKKAANNGLYEAIKIIEILR